MVKNKDTLFEQLIKRSKEYQKTISADNLTIEQIFYTFLMDKNVEKILKKYGVKTTVIRNWFNDFIKNRHFHDTDLETESVETFYMSYKISEGCNKETITNDQNRFILDTLLSLIGCLTEEMETMCAKNNLTFNTINDMYQQMVDKRVEDRIIQKVQTDEIMDKIKSIGSYNSLVERFTIKYLDTITSKEPLIGRNTELTLAQQILLRKSKSNVIIVGDNGIGKTKLIEEVAKEIHKKDKKIDILSLNLNNLTAGVMIKGELESRINLLFSELKEITRPILIIENIHTICSGDNSLQGDVSNALKPFLKNSNVKIIGTTTPEEYRKNIEKDEMFAKNFFKMHLEEPSFDETKKIVKGLVPSFEKYFGCKYSDETINLILDCAKRFVSDKKFPEKAIDILDMVGATSKYNSDKTITDKMVYSTLSSMLGIPLENISQNECDIYKNLENSLNKEIFGQEEAIKKVSDAVIISRSGLRELNKTASSIMLSGQSGCGKTELCRVLSKILNLPLVRFDMSEYMEDHSVSKLIGSPPGYKDSGNGKAGNGLLINEVDEHPCCILLLDEIEKAHPKIHNLLLQVMDNGRLTSAIGKSVSFEHVFLIMTSNVGSSVAHKTTIGFNKTGESRSLSEYNSTFLPEFRSRIDAMVMFNNLTDSVLRDISKKFLGELSQILLEKHIMFSYNENVVEYIVKKAKEANNGARPIKNIITYEIKNIIARNIVFGKYVNGGNIHIDVNDGKIIIEG